MPSKKSRTPQKGEPSPEASRLVRPARAKRTVAITGAAPLGLIPAPTKWRIEFGEPIRLDGYGPEAADDSLLVGRLTEKVRSTIQGMLDRSVADRQSVWFG